MRTIHGQEFLLHTDKLWSRSEVLSIPSPVPKLPGVYAWYFKDIPPEVPVNGCIVSHGFTLLYIGIAPQEPSLTGKISERDLRDRLHSHYNGNAEGSTLRRSLGCLLSERLGIRLEHKRSRTAYTFGKGEVTLSEWMGENAFVTWMVMNEPWLEEKEFVHTINPPLNIQHNYSNLFRFRLKAIRKAAKDNALVMEG